MCKIHIVKNVKYILVLSSGVKNAFANLLYQQTAVLLEAIEFHRNTNKCEVLISKVQVSWGMILRVWVCKWRPDACWLRPYYSILFVFLSVLFAFYLLTAKYIHLHHCQQAFLTVNHGSSGALPSADSQSHVMPDYAHSTVILVNRPGWRLDCWALLH